jgi:hypothetical protein
MFNKCTYFQAAIVKRNYKSAMLRNQYPEILSNFVLRSDIRQLFILTSYGILSKRMVLRQFRRCYSPAPFPPPPLLRTPTTAHLTAFNIRPSLAKVMSVEVAANVKTITLFNIHLVRILEY